MIKVIGWIGAIAFSLCGLPQAYDSYKEGNSDRLNVYYLTLCSIGEIGTLFALISESHLWYMLFNYGANLIFLLVMWKYKIQPRKKGEVECLRLAIRS